MRSREGRFTKTAVAGYCKGGKRGLQKEVLEELRSVGGIVESPMSRYTIKKGVTKENDTNENTEPAAVAGFDESAATSKF